MTSKRSLVWLGKAKEKQALKLFKKHIKSILETTELMDKTIHAFCNNEKDIKENSNRTQKKERDADIVKSEILNELSKGNFPPISSEAIIRLVTSADDIATNARGAASKITLLDPSELNKELRNDLKTFSSLVLETIKLLDNTYSIFLKNPKKSLIKTDEVEKMEEKIDHFRYNKVLPQLINWADQIQKPGTSMALLNIEENLEESADQAENVADIIRGFAIRSD